MEVNLNIKSAGPVPSTSLQPKDVIQADSTDAVEFSGTTALNQSFDKIPDVRPEAVARARQLVSQTDYPPAETMKKLAVLFAFNLGQKSTGL